MDFIKEELVKSPLNYIGGKFKLLPQILPFFPNKINMFYDVFGGGGTMSLNVKSEHIYFNDIVPYVSDLFLNIKGETSDNIVDKIKTIINKYELSKTNKEGFEKLRNDYNNGYKSWDMFYTLICYSFNNQFRFNNNHNYNSSFGKHKSCFSNITENKIRKSVERLNNIDISFSSIDYLDIDYTDADENDLIYFDPPYLISCGNYNDGKRGFKGWGQSDDLNLMNLCDRLNSQGTRFALSNVLECNGKSNDVLKEWCKKYNIHLLNYSYKNCNYHKNNKDSNTIEVLITNF